jgi:hypothetical protein
MIEEPVLIKKPRSKIKVKHVAMANTLEIDPIFWAVVAATKLVYPTAEEEQAAMMEAKLVFEKEVHDIVSEAFRIGKKIGKYSADEKDTKLYKKKIKPCQ